MASVPVDSASSAEPVTPEKSRTAAETDQHSSNEKVLPTEYHSSSCNSMTTREFGWSRFTEEERSLVMQTPRGRRRSTRGLRGSRGAVGSRGSIRRVSQRCHSRENNAATSSRLPNFDNVLQTFESLCQQSVTPTKRKRGRPPGKRGVSRAGARPGPPPLVPIWPGSNFNQLNVDESGLEKSGHTCDESNSESSEVSLSIDESYVDKGDKDPEVSSSVDDQIIVDTTSLTDTKSELLENTDRTSDAESNSSEKEIEIITETIVKPRKQVRIDQTTDEVTHLRLSKTSEQLLRDLEAIEYKPGEVDENGIELNKKRPKSFRRKLKEVLRRAKEDANLLEDFMEYKVTVKPDRMILQRLGHDKPQANKTCIPYKRGNDKNFTTGKNERHHRFHRARNTQERTPREPLFQECHQFSQLKPGNHVVDISKAPLTWLPHTAIDHKASQAAFMGSNGTSTQLWPSLREKLPRSRNSVNSGCNDGCEVPGAPYHVHSTGTVVNATPIISPDSTQNNDKQSLTGHDSSIVSHRAAVIVDPKNVSHKLSNERPPSKQVSFSKDVPIDDTALQRTVSQSSFRSEVHQEESQNKSTRLESDSHATLSNVCGWTRPLNATWPLSSTAAADDDIAADDIVFCIEEQDVLSSPAHEQQEAATVLQLKRANSFGSTLPLKKRCLKTTQLSQLQNGHSKLLNNHEVEPLQSENETNSSTHERSLYIEQAKSQLCTITKMKNPLFDNEGLKSSKSAPIQWSAKIIGDWSVISNTSNTASSNVNSESRLKADIDRRTKDQSKPRNKLTPSDDSDSAKSTTTDIGQGLSALEMELSCTSVTTVVAANNTNSTVVASGQIQRQGNRRQREESHKPGNPQGSSSPSHAAENNLTTGHTQPSGVENNPETRTANSSCHKQRDSNQWRGLWPNRQFPSYNQPKNSLDVNEHSPSTIKNPYLTDTNRFQLPETASTASAAAHHMKNWQSVQVESWDKTPHNSKHWNPATYYMPSWNLPGHRPQACVTSNNGKNRWETGYPNEKDWNVPDNSANNLYSVPPESGETGVHSSARNCYQYPLHQQQKVFSWQNQYNTSIQQQTQLQSFYNYPYQYQYDLQPMSTSSKSACGSQDQQKHQQQQQHYQQYFEHQRAQQHQNLQQHQHLQQHQSNLQHKHQQQCHQVMAQQRLQYHQQQQQQRQQWHVPGGDLIAQNSQIESTMAYPFSWGFQYPFTGNAPPQPPHQWLSHN